MSIHLYFDHNVARVVVNGLRLRGVNVLTAYEDHTHTWTDADLLDRATQLERALVTHDDDLLVEGARRQQTGIPFFGIIYAHSERISIGTLISDLELMAKAMEPQDIVNRIAFLPL